jgi:hypothetical protein
MSRRLARPLLAIVALCVLAVSLAPARGQAPPGADRLCDGGSGKVLRSGKWTTVEKPEGLSKITAHAVGGDSAKLMLVTDGHTVMRSTDRGCSWKTVYTVASPSAEDTPLDGVLPEISRMLIPTGSSRVILVLDGLVKTVGAQVLVSDKAGDEGSFVEAQGVPDSGQFRDVVSAADNPDVIYLVTTVNDQAGQVDPAGATGPLYISNDGGRSFAQAGGGGQIERLAVEPDTGGRYLWAARSSGVIESSRDYGATWEAHPIEPTGEEPDVTQGEIPESPVKWLDVAVFRFATTAHVVVALGAPNRQADVTRAVASYDKGKTWEDFPVDGLGPAGGLFFGSSDDQLFSAVPTDNTAYRGPGLLEFSFEEFRWVGIDDFALGSLKDPRAVREPQAGDPQYNSIWLRRDKPDPDAPDLLARFEPPPADPSGRRFTGRPDCGGKPASKVKTGSVEFKPGQLSVQLEPGQPASIPLIADVPGDPTPSDLFFLMDHSDSMDPAIEGLFCSVERLIRDVPERGLDAYFGLGAYNGIDSYTYRRLVDILPPEEAGPAVSAELKKLFSTAGVDEPLRSALFQTATGAGFTGRPKGRPVEPGQQADWRPAEKKVPRYVLVITDEPYEETTQGEPAYQAVVDALKAKNINVIGLRVQPFGSEQVTSADHSPARQLLLLQQLTNFARDTGALAPKGGVDCDGGGTPDVQTGEPIVCTISEQGIKREFDDTLISVLTALAGEDMQTVKLVPRDAGGLRAEIQGGEATVNLRRASRVEGTAVLSCTEDQQGRKFDVTFDVVTGERVLGSLQGAAQCGQTPAVVPPVVPGKSKPPAKEPAPKPAAKKSPAPAQEQPAPVPPAQAPVPQAAVAVAPPPPPPAPAPISSAPAQAPAPASANAAAPQAGAANQEDRQVASKLAVVSADPGVSDDGARGQHAMVDRKPGEHHMVASRPTAFPEEAAYTLGIGIAGLFGFMAWAGDPRRRRKRDVRPVKAD